MIYLKRPPYGLGLSIRNRQYRHSRDTLYAQYTQDPHE